MTKKSIIEEGIKRKNWSLEDWKTSKDDLDRLIWFIAIQSPHNLWRAIEPLLILHDKAFSAGVAEGKAVEHHCTGDNRPYCETHSKKDWCFESRGGGLGG